MTPIHKKTSAMNTRWRIPFMPSTPAALAIAIHMTRATSAARPENSEYLE